ncbi:MAG: hypothetical protein WD402_03335 [Chloroflexota bacterium]
MRIAYLLVADSANQSNDGKLNVLGMGVRVINAPVLPFPVALTVLVSAQLDHAERGAKHVKLSLATPSGSQVLIDDTAPMESRENMIENLPLQLNFQFVLSGLAFKEAGLHHFIVEIEGERAEYPFVVQILGTEVQSSPG